MVEVMKLDLQERVREPSRRACQFLNETVEVVLALIERQRRISGKVVLLFFP